MIFSLGWPGMDKPTFCVSLSVLCVLLCLWNLSFAHIAEKEGERERERERERTETRTICLLHKPSDVYKKNASGGKNAVWGIL